VLKGGSWYVVCAVGKAFRTYRVSNILQLTSTGEEFTRPDGFDLARHWREHLDEFDSRRFTGSAVVRISARLVPRLTDLSAAMLLKATSEPDAATDADGNITVSLPIESASHAASQLVRFGSAVEVLAPQELRDELHQLASSLLELYPARPAKT
jgi:predicted DNA-binding transcriptional regulator YafY